MVFTVLLGGGVGTARVTVVVTAGVARVTVTVRWLLLSTVNAPAEAPEVIKAKTAI